MTVTHPDPTTEREGVKVNCPFCKGYLAFEIGYIAYRSGMAHLDREDRIYCVNCGRYRFLEEKGVRDDRLRKDALPERVLRMVDHYGRRAT